MYEPPTLDDFLARFPMFTGQEEQIEAHLEDAIAAIGPSWIERDRKLATMLLVAHNLMADGAGGNPGVIRSESFGPISVSYADVQGASGPLGTTEYGRRFLALRKANFPGPVVV